MPDLLAHVIWWTGSVVWLLAAIYGLSEMALWCLDKALKSLGLWPGVYAVMRRYYRERVDAVDGKPGQ